MHTRTLLCSHIRLANSAFCVIKVSRSNNSTGRRASYLSYSLRKYGSHLAITSPQCRENFFTGESSSQFEKRSYDTSLTCSWILPEFIAYIFTPLNTSSLINGGKKNTYWLPLALVTALYFPRLYQTAR